MKKFEAVISIEKKVLIFAKDISEAEEKAARGEYTVEDGPKPLKITALMVYPAQVELDDAIEEGTRVWKAVIAQAVAVQLSSSEYVPYVEPGDRKGVCHHLANDNKIRWVKP